MIRGTISDIVMNKDTAITRKPSGNSEVNTSVSLKNIIIGKLFISVQESIE